MSTEKNYIMKQKLQQRNLLTKLLVILNIKYLKLYFLDSEALDSVKIKSKKDLSEKLQKGLDDVREDKVYSIEETFS